MQADRSCEKRLTEMALRAEKTGVAQITGFLSPAEQAQAAICAGKAGVQLFRSGDAEGAERRMVAFADVEWQPCWPAVWLELRWSGKSDAAKHRDVLGSILALGVDRSNVGDIHVGDRLAHVYAREPMSAFITANLLRVGGVAVTVCERAEQPSASPEQHETIKASLASTRLDAVLGAAWHMARSKAAEIVASGRVQVDYQPEMRPDRQLAEGATVSVRGFGRVKLLEIGTKTRKGRIFVTLLRN